MIITRNIIKLGDSKVISLPEELSEGLNIKDKVVFDVTVLRNLNSNENIKNYECFACHASFSVNPLVEEICCPRCSNKNQGAFREIIINN